MSMFSGKEIRAIGQKRSLSVGGGLTPLRNSGSVRIAKKQHVATVVLPKVEKLHGDEEQVPQPSKPVYKRESTLTSRSSKSVVFAQGTKEWLGLRPERHFLDELVHQFFVLGKQFSSVDVIKVVGFDGALLENVNELMRSLCVRIKEAAEAQSQDEEEHGVPVLLQGGGRGMRVTSFHLPYLCSLQQVVAEAAKVVSLQFRIDTHKDCSAERPEELSAPIAL